MDEFHERIGKEPVVMKVVIWDSGYLHTRMWSGDKPDDDVKEEVNPTLLILLIC